MSAAASSRTPALRAQMATRAPSVPSARAMARPIPRFAPVTSAVLPRSPRSIQCLPRSMSRPNPRASTRGLIFRRACSCLAAAPAREARDGGGSQGRQALDRFPDGPGEGLEREAAEATSGQARCAFLEQGAGAGGVAVGEMLIADGDLNQPLKGLAVVVRRPGPVGLEQLVDLEAKPGVEERRRRLQRLVEAVSGRPQRQRAHRFARPLGPEPQEPSVTALV